MIVDHANVTHIVMPTALFQTIVEHANRKLEGVHLPGEEREAKAYGLIGGRVTGHVALLTEVIPLTRNRRYEPSSRATFDHVVERYAVASTTPFAKRGWLADPAEVLAADRLCELGGAILFGSYHLHRVAWSHDHSRQACTKLDSRLAERSSLWTFILSMVDPDRPVIRAFFEGSNTHEATIVSERTAARGRSPVQ